MSTALGLVKAGLGIAILPEAVTEMDESGEVRCRSISNPVLTRKIEIIQKKDKSLSPAAGHMVELLKQVTNESA
jgi:DNA-binding transcriptional LysR family regulator